VVFLGGFFWVLLGGFFLLPTLVIGTGIPPYFPFLTEFNWASLYRYLQYEMMIHTPTNGLHLHVIVSGFSF
jgi:hypothetical protein